MLSNRLKFQSLRTVDVIKFILVLLNCIGSCWGSRWEGDHKENLGVDGWIILGWISRRWDVGIWTGLDWPRIETGGGRL